MSTHSLGTQKVSFTAEMLTYSSQRTGGAYNNKSNGVHTLLRLLVAPVFGKSTVKSYSVHVHAKCMLTVHVYVGYCILSFDTGNYSCLEAL